jgi:hypothetical protein
MKLDDFAFACNHLWYKLSQKGENTNWLCLTFNHALLDHIDSASEMSDFRCLHPEDDCSSMHDVYTIMGIDKLRLPSKTALNKLSSALKLSMFFDKNCVTSATRSENGKLLNLFCLDGNETKELPVLVLPVLRTNLSYDKFNNNAESLKYLLNAICRNGNFLPYSKTTILCQQVSLRFGDLQNPAPMQEELSKVYDKLVFNAYTSTPPRFLKFVTLDRYTPDTGITTVLIILERKAYFEDENFLRAKIDVMLSFIRKHVGPLTVKFGSFQLVKPLCIQQPTKDPLDDCFIDPPPEDTELPMKMNI